MRRRVNGAYGGPNIECSGSIQLCNNLNQEASYIRVQAPLELSLGHIIESQLDSDSEGSDAFPCNYSFRPRWQHCRGDAEYKF